MFDRINPNDLSHEERAELEAVYGEEAVENRDILELDTDKLEPVDEPEPPASFAEVEDVESDARVEEGDIVTVRFYDDDRSTWTGTCTQTTDESYMHRFRLEGDDPYGEHGTIPKSFQYEDFITTDRGFTVDLVSIEKTD